jgi:predicted phosphodiesterase
MMDKIWILLLAALSVYGCGPSQDEEISFVQLCDPQLGMVDYEQDKLNFQQAGYQINELNPDFVLICGDLVHDASDLHFNDFLSIKDQLNMPAYLVPGNHDIGLMPTNSTISKYREKFGKDYYNFVMNSFSFIAVNTQLWKTEVLEQSKRHDKWLREILEEHKSKDRRQIVFGHYPLFKDSINEENSYFNIDSMKRKEIIQLFKDNDVMIYLSGHKHEYISIKEQDILFISGESTSKNFDKRPLGFRLYETRNDSIFQTFIALD